MNAGPTQEVTPPSSNVQKSPRAAGKRAGPTASPFAPLKRLHCSQKSEVKKKRAKWELWSSLVGQRLGWGCWRCVGLVPKTTRRTRSQTQHLCEFGLGLTQHGTNSAPRCQRAQRSQRFLSVRLIWCCWTAGFNKGDFLSSIFFFFFKIWITVWIGQAERAAGHCPGQLVNVFLLHFGEKIWIWITRLLTVTRLRESN